MREKRIAWKFSVTDNKKENIFEKDEIFNTSAKLYYKHIVMIKQHQTYVCSSDKEKKIQKFPPSLFININ